MIVSEKWRVALGWLGTVALGLLVAAAGVVPWVLMARANAHVRPDLPWAAIATCAWLAIYLAWLHGLGPPSAWRAARRYRLRLWRADSVAWSKAGIGVTMSLIGAIAMLTFFWILIGSPGRPPDLGKYPTTAYLVSIFVMGPLVSGVTEEAAYRGYMQRGLERFGAGHALVASAAVFALAHGVHGIEHLLLLGPGIFVAGVLYGLLARHTGSIVPGMLVHFLGDLAYTFFGTLGGDWRLLVVS